MTPIVAAARGLLSENQKRQLHASMAIDVGGLRSRSRLSVPMRNPATFRARERRQFGRRTTQIQCWVVVPGRPRMPVRLRNVSLTGAFLETDAARWLPFHFDIVIDGRSVPIPCEVRHVGPHGVGVLFRDLEAEVAVPTEAADVLEPERWHGEAPAIRRRNLGVAR